MGFPPAHAAIVGWCEWATHMIVLAPLMTGISFVTGFLATSGPRGRAALAMALLLLVAPPFALHLVTTPRGALLVLLGVPLAFVVGLGLVVIAATLQGRARRP